MSGTTNTKPALVSSMATRPSVLLQSIYLVLGLSVAFLLLLSIIIGARHERPLQVVYGVGLLLLMSGLFYIHVALTPKVVIAAEPPENQLLKIKISGRKNIKRMRKLKLEELNRVSVAEFKELPKIPVVLVLDNVRSLHNVGSAFRTGDAFRVEKIYLVGITGTPPNKEINKTALGATESVAWEHVAEAVPLVEQLKQDGFKIIALEQAEGSVLLQDFIPDAEQKYAFVFGNEVFGVADAIMAVADTVLEIPQFGTKHSLNISVTVGVVVWDYLSKTELGES